MEIEDSKYAKTLQDGKIELTDQNGKTIITTFEEICDASTGVNKNVSNIENRDISNISVECKITDSEGVDITNEDLISAVKNNEVAALDVTFEATHTNRLINCALYTEESMAEDFASFMVPYGKPLIKNHNTNNEPLGRIINANYDQSEILEDTGTINATWRVTDKEAIEKFADGRYKTMSIGASCKRIVCNTCGKTILNNGKAKFCGHWRGETYKDSLCTWTMTGLTYREGSIVNDPADPYAQVKNIKVIKISKKGVNEKMDGQENKDFAQVDSILNGIDDNDADNIKNQTENQENIENNNDNVAGNDGNNELTTIKNELESTKAELEAIKNDLAVKDAEIETLKAEKIVSESNIKNCKEQLVSLAKMNKSLLVKNAVILDPNLKAEDLEKQNASQVAAIINSLETARRRTPKTVENPALHNTNDANTITEGAEAKDEQKEEKNLKDYEKVVSDLFFK